MNNLKTCNKCNLSLSWEHYGISKNGKHRNRCRKCEKLQNREYYAKNKEKKLMYCKKRYDNNKARVLAINKAWSDKNKERHDDSIKKWADNNKDKRKEANVKYYKKHRQNNEDYRLRKLDQMKIRRATDVEYNLLENCRSRIYSSLKSQSTKKNNRSIKLLGCSTEFFKRWLEHQFNSVMNWENYGTYWEMDHVIPCASFELTKEEERLKCFNWTNVRPLSKETNNSKSDKIYNQDILLQEIKVYYYKRQIQTAGTS